MVGSMEFAEKRSPVCTAVYRMRPSIRFPKPLVGEDAERMKQTCPMGVFDIEDLGGEKTHLQQSAGMGNVRLDKIRAAELEESPELVAVVVVANENVNYGRSNIFIYARRFEI